ncbi:hypothetical protein LPJ61_001351 [Coemansia biformis]|uniref:Uncharacterized protein n=1 Tax=Coemansia biformis TaxID=1286918 RepID=A0A9W7YFC0_9FUNG|nr:hypothetical protein LPJ61_001351 [Coemansia biformis]
MSAEHARAKSLGEAMLLEALLDRSSRLAIRALDQRAQLGRMHERSHEATGDARRLRGSAAALYPELQGTFAVVDRLRTRAENSEQTEGLRARLKIYELLRTCFSSVLLAPASTAAPQPRAWQHTATDAPPAAGGPPHGDVERHYLWTLVRPSQPPAEVVRLFLSLSAQVAQLPRDHVDGAQPLMVGRMWYRLLADLLVQLAISAHEYGECAAKQVQQSMDLVSPSSESRASMHPPLWCSGSAEHVAQFDRAWQDVHRLVASLGRQPTAASGAEALLRLCSPHDFWHRLEMYLSAVLNCLDPPLLDVYSNIRQSGSFPQGFFDVPEQATDAPARPQPMDQSSPAGANATVANLAPLDPFSPRSPLSAPRTAQRALAGPSDGGAAESPSERVAQTRAYGAMAASAQRAFTQRLPMLVCDGDHDDGDESCTSDVEMSPSQHASIKRQKSSDLALLGSAETTPRQCRHSARAGALGGDGADLEGTVVMESPSALLSARHDKRVRATVERTQPPPPAMYQTVEEGNDACAEPKSPRSPRQPPCAAADDAAMPTTPTSQSRKKPPTSIADWAWGDIEGGGRPHRRRHFDAAAPGTPKGLRPSILQTPPPQTLLSPRNLAAAQRNNIPLAALIAECAGHRSTAAGSPGQTASTPDRAGSADAENRPLQVTPEHQIGPTADILARSASRYVVRKDQGDTEGGGRKHRKRLRSSHGLFAHKDV